MTNPTPRRAGWVIEPVGSAMTGWALVHTDEIKASHPSAFVLGAYGADTQEAWLVAKAMAKRGWPTPDERRAVFTPDGEPPLSP